MGREILSVCSAMQLDLFPQTQQLSASNYLLVTSILICCHMQSKKKPL